MSWKGISGKCAKVPAPQGAVEAEARRKGDQRPHRWRRRYLRAMFLKRVLYYLDPRTLFGKADPNSSVRFMHGINRISILLFLFCVTVMVIRACTR